MPLGAVAMDVKYWNLGHVSNHAHQNYTRHLVMVEVDIPRHLLHLDLLPLLIPHILTLLILLGHKLEDPIIMHRHRLTTNDMIVRHIIFLMILDFLQDPKSPRQDFSQLE